MGFRGEKFAFDSPAEAVSAMIARLAASQPAPASERVPLNEARGRFLARPIRLDRDSPAFDHSAMDGYALRAADAGPGARLAVVGSAPAGHPWATAKTLRPEQLLDEPLLMLGAGNCFRDQVLDLCHRASQGESPQVLEGSSLETIRHMVSSGVGVTVMPSSSVDGIPADDPLLRVKPFVKPSPTRRVGLVWRSSFPRHKAIDVMRQSVLDCRLPGTRAIH